MIDIHSHILPGVDDGADTIEESIEMAKQAVANGIHKMVATPHHQTTRFFNIKPVIKKKVIELNEVLTDLQIPLEILVGQEVRIYGEWVEDFQKGEIASINDTQYVLIEFPFNHVPNYVEQLFYDIQMRGFIPIIAHPERNLDLLENPDKLLNLVQKGSLSQITAASVTGYFGKKIQRFTYKIIEANLTHVIASDFHNTITRPNLLAQANRLIEKKFGIEKAVQFRDNANSIINGEPVFSELPQPVRTKKLGLF